MQNAATAAPVTPSELLAIGIERPGQGGIYAGSDCDANCHGAHHLIVGPEAPELMTWDAAMKWAASLKIDGHKDFVLPTRRDLVLISATVPELVNEAGVLGIPVYWSCEWDAKHPALAWTYHFISGRSFRAQKGHRKQARAVRRLPID